MFTRFQHWPWLTLQIVISNIAIILALAAAWYFAFKYQSNIYSDRLMSTFNIEPGALHAMYVGDVERQLWTSVLIGLFLAGTTSVVLAFFIVQPLRSLARATERLRHGDYTVRSNISKGEVGRLAGTVNALAATLEREEDRRTRYMADLSHELRTPIMSLRGYIEGLEDGIFQADENYFKRMAGELSQLSSLTATIESMQLDAAKQPSEESPKKTIKEIIAGAQDRWHLRFSQADLTLETNVAEPLNVLSVTMSECYMKQIFDNLMSNMVRYASPLEPCRIEVEKVRSTNHIGISFSNLAPDIDANALPLLFDRFFRVSECRIREDGEQPRGLGLSIVRQLCWTSGGNAKAHLENNRLIITIELALVK